MVQESATWRVNSGSRGQVGEDMMMTEAMDNSFPMRDLRTGGAV